MSAQGLPAHILALFTPRPPPQHLPPQVSRTKASVAGFAEYVECFAKEKAPKREPWESPKERKERRMSVKSEEHKKDLKKLIEKYDPHKDPNADGDPFKTLFVARVSYDTTEKKLKREFEAFGSVKRVKMVYDQKGKPRGYAFIEYEHERDLKTSYKQGDGKKIDGRRVMVDVERGRTVEGWLPRRLGGGRGPGREGKSKKKKAAEKPKDKDRDRDRDRGDRKDRDGGKDRDRDRGKDRDEKKDDRGGRDRDRGGDKKRDRSKSRDRDRDAKRPRDDKRQ